MSRVTQPHLAQKIQWLPNAAERGSRMAAGMPVQGTCLGSNLAPTSSPASASRPSNHLPAASAQHTTTKKLGVAAASFSPDTRDHPPKKQPAHPSPPAHPFPLHLSLPHPPAPQNPIVFIIISLNHCKHRGSPLTDCLLQPLGFLGVTSPSSLLDTRCYLPLARGW